MNYILSEGYKISVEDESPVLITKSIADVLNPEQRKRDFSKEIEVHGTADNLKFFRGYFSFTSTSDGFNFDATKKIQADYYSENSNIFPNCFLMLNKVVKKEGTFFFSIQLFSELKNVFLELRKHDVNELDYSDLNHTLSKANIKSSWAFSSDYSYCLVDNGNRTLLDTWRTTDLQPYVRVKRIINQMLTKVGVDPASFQFSTNINTYLNEMVYGYGGGEKPKISAIEVAQRLVDVSGTLTYVPPEQAVERSLRTIRETLGATYSNTTTSNPLGQYADYEIQVARTGRYRITFDLGGTVTYLTPPGTTAYPNRATIYKNGISLGYKIDGANTFSISNTVDLNLQSGDLLTFTYSQKMALSTLDGSIQRPSNVDLNFDVNLQSLDEEVIDGATIEVGNYLPSMNCADFLNGIITIFNLYLSDNNDSNITTIDKLPSFYKLANEAVRIDGLVDYSKDIELIPLANQFAKNIHFKYKENKDFDNTTYFDKFGVNYGDATIVNQSDFATGEKVFQLPFSNVVPANSIIGVDATIPRFVIAQEDGTFKPNKGNPRIGFHNTMTCNFKLADSSGNNVETITSAATLHHFRDYLTPTYDLNFTLVQEVFYPTNSVTIKNLYNENYKVFIDESTSKDSRLLKLSLKLNSLDVKQLDFRKFRYYQGSYYRLNKVEDFNGNTSTPDTTKVELIKVLEPKSKPNIIFPTSPQPTIEGGFSGNPIIGDFDFGLVSGTVVTPKIVNKFTQLYTNARPISGVDIPTPLSEGATITIYNTSGVNSLDVSVSGVLLDTVQAKGIGIFKVINGVLTNVFN